MEKEEKALEKSEQRGRPYGDDKWTLRTVSKFGLQTTMRSRGRQRQRVIKSS
jgi:putative transposase